MITRRALLGSVAMSPLAGPALANAPEEPAYREFEPTGLKVYVEDAATGEWTGIAEIRDVTVRADQFVVSSGDMIFGEIEPGVFGIEVNATGEFDPADDFEKIMEWM